MKNKNKGFTLIEVLMVVVIIGVLAALIVPRFAAAPERAFAAEANQMLGSLKRAQMARVDLVGSGTSWLTISNNTDTTNWGKLNLAAPSSTAKFDYSCSNSTNSCTARSQRNAGDTMTVNATGWACAGNYTAMTNGGCTVG